MSLRSFLPFIVFAAPHSEFKHYCGALSMAWIGATMAATLAVHHPFTLGIARRKAPKEVWNTPSFLRMNTVITSVWAVSFLAAAVGIALSVATDAGTVAQLGFQLLGFAIPFAFTTQYPKMVRARLASANTNAPAAAL